MEIEDIIEGKQVEDAVETAPVVEEVKAEESPEVAEEPTKEPEKEPEAKETAKEHVPLATYLDERSERKALEARISDMEANMRKEPEAKVPDMFADPEGYNKHLADKMQQVETNTRMDISQAMAEEKHGQEAVAEAFEALKASKDQSAINSILAARLPYQQLMTWNKQRVAMQEIGDDPVAWKESESKRLRDEIEKEVTAKLAKESAGNPAPSMADTTGTGGGPKGIWDGPTSLERALG